MIKLEKYNGEKTYMYPNGELASPSRIENDFPAILHFTHVLEVNGDICQAVMNLSALRNMHNIDTLLTEEEAIKAIEVIINTPPAEPKPTAEERIAAQLEFQSMMMI